MRFKRPRFSERLELFNIFSKLVDFEVVVDVVEGVNEDGRNVLVDSEVVRQERVEFAGPPLFGKQIQMFVKRKNGQDNNLFLFIVRQVFSNCRHNKSTYSLVF